MVESIQQFISNYGYFVVFFASMIEGESVIITASILASQGHLDITKVVLFTFLGTVFADQGLYFVGRIFGQKLFQRFPELKVRAKKIFDFLDRYTTGFILSFRFVYGIRILSPIVIGMSNVKPKRYMVLNLIAAIIWTLLSCAAGYYLGDIIFTYLKAVDARIKWAMILLIAVGALHIIHKLSQKITHIDEN